MRHAPVTMICQERRASFVALHYVDAAGRPAKLRASPERLVYVAPPNLNQGPSARAHGLPPGGAAWRADMVGVGDSLAVRLDDDGGDGTEGGVSFYTAKVTAITRWVQLCAASGVGGGGWVGKGAIRRRPFSFTCFGTEPTKCHGIAPVCKTAGTRTCHATFWDTNQPSHPLIIKLHPIPGRCTVASTPPC